MSKFRWIRSEPLRNLLIKAEHLDLVGDTEFFCVADMIDVLAKNMVEEGLLSEKQWDPLCEKYPINASRRCTH